MGVWLFTLKHSLQLISLCLLAAYFSWFFCPGLAVARFWLVAHDKELKAETNGRVDLLLAYSF